jgi:tetratricopeptide (TPR) repeat protein
VDLNERIENFRKMVEGSPNDELGHFSLGKLLIEAGRVEEAIKEFDRVVELNPNQGRAYQMSASALLKLGHRDKAVEKLKAGVQVAHARGDMMPKNEMLKMLEELGVAPPELKRAEPEGSAPSWPSLPFQTTWGKRFSTTSASPAGASGSGRAQR